MQSDMYTSVHIFFFCAAKREKERAGFGACARVQWQKKGRGALKQISERVCRVQTVMFGKNVHTATTQRVKEV